MAQTTVLIGVNLCLTEIDLKKQSQFVPARIGTKSYMKGDYVNKTAFGAKKNKANQSQFISVQCSAFSGQRQDEEKVFEKTKPMLK